MKKLLLFCLMASALAALSGCADVPPTTTTTTTEETTIVHPPPQ